MQLSLISMIYILCTQADYTMLSDAALQVASYKVIANNFW